MSGCIWSQMWCLRPTPGGGKELLQASRRALQLLVLMGLQNHLQLVQLLHQLGLGTGLGLVLLQGEPTETTQSKQITRVNLGLASRQSQKLATRLT